MLEVTIPIKHQSYENQSYENAKSKFHFCFQKSRSCKIRIFGRRYKLVKNQKKMFIVLHTDNNSYFHYSALLCCAQCPFHRGIQVLTDRHFGDSDVKNIKTFILFLSARSSTFLSVWLWDTWICRLLPAIHAHLPCTTLLTSEEYALLKERERER